MGICQGRQMKQSDKPNFHIKTQSTKQQTVVNQEGLLETNQLNGVGKEKSINPLGKQNSICDQPVQIVIVDQNLENKEPIGDQGQNDGAKQLQISLHNQNLQSEQLGNHDHSQNRQIEIQKAESPEKISNCFVNKYAHFIQSTFNLAPGVNKNQNTNIMDSIQVLNNGDLQKQQNDKTTEPNRNYSCYHCNQKIDYVMYIIPCSHQYHLDCLLDRISEQIKNKELKIKCKCSSRIHINFLRRIDIQNKLNLITEILNGQAQQLMEMNKDKFENYELIEHLFNTQKSKQDYYYGNINCTQELIQTNITPGE